MTHAIAGALKTPVAPDRVGRPWRNFRRLALLALMLVGAPEAWAADRVALVIGNSAYKHHGALANPVNDAADVSAMFGRMGFEVVEGVDLDGVGLRAKIKEFRDKLQSGSLAVFYYSGHGIQVDGRNFIIPIDAKIEKPEDVDLETVDMDAILAIMRADDRVTIVVLDACRNNPFARSLRSVTRAAESAYEGLAPISNSVGSMIIFATDPGNVARDGDGRNSPFTQAFLKNAPTPGVEISQMVKRVRLEVMQATAPSPGVKQQVPWDSSSLVHDVYLAGAPPTARGRRRSRAPAVAAVGVASRSGDDQATKSELAAGVLCDRLATDIQDTLRDRSLAPVRTVDTARAIPACEKAVAEDPKSLRLANQLGRAYLKAERYADALRVFKDAAGRGSPYATNEVGFLYYRGFGGLKKDYAQARPWFEKAAQLGVPVSMANLAVMYAHGIGVERNPEKAVMWLRKGEALGDVGAIRAFAELYLDGLGVPTDPAKAKELYTRAAEMEDPDSMSALGLMAQQGLAGPQDFDAARRWLEKAAAYDSAEGMYNLGYYYSFGVSGAPRDYAIARDWFERSVRHNGIDALIGLAHLYLHGLGVDADPAKARELLEKAAAQDSSGAMVYLAHGWRDGAFGAADPVAMRSWLEKAAALDDASARKELSELDRPEPAGAACDRLAAIRTDPLRPRDLAPAESIDAARAIPACEKALAESPANLRYANQLGLAYITGERAADARRVFALAAQKKSAFAALWMGNIQMRGLDVPVDKPAARRWYEQAAALGSSDALYNLALLYREGEDVRKDGAKARQLFEKSAALGDVGAMRQLGEMHYLGDGVAEDNSKAREWYEKAAALDDATSKRRLGEIYLKGYGVKADPAAARLWFQRAAASDDSEAMRQLAELYLNAIGGEREPQKARGLLEQASAAGNARAMTLLAQVLLAGAVGDVDEAGARKSYEKAAALGDKIAQDWLAAHGPAAAPDLAKGDLCDKSAGSQEDPLRSVEFPPVETIDVTVAVPACEAAHAAAPDNLRWANQLARAYLYAHRDLEFDARIPRGGGARFGVRRAVDGQCSGAGQGGFRRRLGPRGRLVDQGRRSRLVQCDVQSRRGSHEQGAIRQGCRRQCGCGSRMVRARRRAGRAGFDDATGADLQGGARRPCRRGEVPRLAAQGGGVRQQRRHAYSGFAPLPGRGRSPRRFRRAASAHQGGRGRRRRRHRQPRLSAARRRRRPQGCSGRPHVA